MKTEQPKMSREHADIASAIVRELFGGARKAHAACEASGMQPMHVGVFMMELGQTLISTNRIPNAEAVERHIAIAECQMGVADAPAGVQ